MSKADDTYQNSKVYSMDQGNALGIDSDGTFNFYGDSVTGAQLRTALFSNRRYSVVATSGAILSSPNLPDGGVLVISASNGGVDLSAWLPSCNAGAELLVLIRRNGNGDISTGSVYISLSGVSLVGLSHQDLSSISLHNSNGSAGFIRFFAASANEWAVIDRDISKVVERPSA